jgi:hypothetical protein
METNLYYFIIGSVETFVKTFVESSVETFVKSSVKSSVETFVKTFVESSVKTFVESSVKSSVETFVESSVGARCGTHFLINHPFLDMSPISGFVQNLVLNLHQDLALDLCDGCILPFIFACTVHLYQKNYSI